MAVKFLRLFKRLYITKDLHKDLLRYSLFKGLNAYERKLVAEYLHIREFKAGDSVFEEGYPLEVVYFIESGELQLTPLFADEPPTLLKKHQFVGLIDFFSGKKRLSSAKAITDLKLMALSGDDLQELLTKDPDLGVKMLRASCSFLSTFIRDHALKHNP